MSVSSAKRPRVDSNAGLTGDSSRSLAPASRAEINELVKNLSEDNCRKLLSEAASMDSDVLLSIRLIIRRQELEAAMAVHEFDWHSRAIWRELNVTYRSMGGSAQYDMSPSVEDSIIESIDQICDKAAKPMASFGTKRNGLEVLRKIGKSIALSSDTLGHEVQMRFQWDSSLVDGMKSIVEAMSRNQREAMCLWNDGRGRWRNKLDELIRLSEQKCCFEGLYDVRDMLLEHEEWSEEEEEGSEGSQSQDYDGDGNEDQDDGEDENDGTT